MMTPKWDSKRDDASSMPTEQSLAWRSLIGQQNGTAQALVRLTFRFLRENLPFVRRNAQRIFHNYDGFGGYA
jgi:hypothetical protein